MTARGEKREEAARLFEYFYSRSSAYIRRYEAGLCPEEQMLRAVREMLAAQVAYSAALEASDDEPHLSTLDNQQRAHAQVFTALYSLAVRIGARSFIAALADVAVLLAAHAPLEDDRADWHCISEAAHNCFEAPRAESDDDGHNIM